MARFHRVELVQMRLSPAAAQIVSQIVFDLMSLAASALVTWQLIRLALNSWRTEDVAPTPLQTPLWMPQTSMGIGMVAACASRCCGPSPPRSRFCVRERSQ